MLERELDLYWKTVVNTIRDGLMVVDECGTIVSVNAALETITGYSRHELIGRDCSVLQCNICEDARRDGGDKWCTLFRGGFLNARQCVFHRKDGRIVHVLKNACLLKDDQGQVFGAVETVTDISLLVEKENQIAAYQRQLNIDNGFHGIIGSTPGMRRVFDLISNAAQSDAPVILLGESGTGKELAAQAIHDIGARRNAPFIKANCAAFTESLLESELFGHVKGAFTGAYRDRSGRFENASGGNIFLDEIGDLPIATQIKLLRVLENKIIERVGDGTPIPVNVRIISATNRNLKELVESGRFREDLFFRINVIPIQLPPLRDRRDDIPLLARYFFETIGAKNNKSITGISDDSMARLMAYNWPGNVRELKSAFEYAFVTCQEGLIRSAHLPPTIVGELPPVVKPTDKKATRVNKEDVKRIELVDALRRCDGNQSKAAELLGVTRVTIWNRMRRLGIQSAKTIAVDEGATVK